MAARLSWPLIWLGGGVAALVLAGCGASSDAPASKSRTPAGVAQAKPIQPENSTSRGPAPIEAIPVTVAEVKRQPIASFLQSTATLESSARVQVSAKTAGLAARVVVEEGDRVTPGQTVAQLDDDEARLALNRARIQLAEAELAYKSLAPFDQQGAQLELRGAELAAADAREKHKKAVAMERRGLASQEDVAAAQTQLAIAKVAVQQARVQVQYKAIDDARFRYERAQTELAEAELRLRHMTVTAPVAGVISERHVVTGQFVQQHQAVVTIVERISITNALFSPRAVTRSACGVGEPAAGRAPPAAAEPRRRGMRYAPFTYMLRYDRAIILRDVPNRKEDHGTRARRYP